MSTPNPIIFSNEPNSLPKNLCFTSTLKIKIILVIVIFLFYIWLAKLIPL